MVSDYISKKYVSAKALGELGMRGTLYAAVRSREVEQAYIHDFIELARQGLFLGKA